MGDVMKQKYLEIKYARICQMINILEKNYNIKKDVKKELEDAYNKMYMYKYKLELLGKKSYDIPTLNSNSEIIFSEEYETKEHNLNNEMLSGLENKQFYTKEEAENLIKWTVNNTRENLKILCNTDNLDNCDLTGTCGFSQFSSIYPLEKLGLKVTYSNIANLFDKNGGMHAFGTVEIPIKDNGEILTKKYIIDCTYSQFFILKNCVESRYLNSYINNGIIASPMVGYFMKNNTELKQFAKQMLENGYCEMTDNNLMKYCYGLYLQEFNANEVKNAMINFQKLNIIDKLENYSIEGDYSIEEFQELGCNLEIKPLKKHTR